MNNIVSGGMFAKDTDAVQPEFVSYSFHEHWNRPRQSTDDIAFWTKPIYLNNKSPARQSCKESRLWALVDLGELMTSSFQAPVFLLEKRSYPNYPAWKASNWTPRFLWESCPPFLNGWRPFHRGHVAKYFATLNGEWETCFPDEFKLVVKNEVEPDAMTHWLCNRAPMFASGILITKPIMTKIRFEKPWYDALTIVSFWSGLLFLAHMVFRCLFIPSCSTPSSPLVLIGLQVRHRPGAGTQMQTHSLEVGQTTSAAREYTSVALEAPLL